MRAEFLDTKCYQDIINKTRLDDFKFKKYYDQSQKKSRVHDGFKVLNLINEKTNTNDKIADFAYLLQRCFCLWQQVFQSSMCVFLSIRRIGWQLLIIKHFSRKKVWVSINFYGSN